MGYLHIIGLIIIGLFVESTLSTSTGIPSCLDEDGNSVDWYILYKIPVVDAKAPFNTGYAYAYITSEDVKAVSSQETRAKRNAFVKTVSPFDMYKDLLNKGLKSERSKSIKNTEKSKKDQLNWTISSRLLSDDDSMVQRTLAIAYNKNKKSLKNLNTIFYNDQPPPEAEKFAVSSVSRAHAKGVVMIDDKSGDGFWLTHSTPQYPSYTSEKLDFGPTSKRNAQTFMCLNFDVKRSGKQIVNHLITMYPRIYESHITKDLQRMIPELEQLTLENEKKKVRDSVEKLAQVITTRDGQELYLYSKSKKFGDDLYSGWINKEIHSPLYVESWRVASGTPLDSSCPANDYHINNVKDIHVVEGKSTISWPYSKDHSKWAISADKDKSVVCITDINRNESQFSRGGGAVCIKSPIVWQVFSNTIEDVEPCPRGERKRKLKANAPEMKEETLAEFLKFRRTVGSDGLVNN